MPHRLIALAAWIVLAATLAVAQEPAPMIGERSRDIGQLGRGIAIVFSPDLATKGNRRFYESLGFSYFESTSWAAILEQLQNYNDLHPQRKLGLVLIETHGTNGNGLKVQASYDPKAARSYVSVGALEEALVLGGIHVGLISACNTGRLFRPEIFKALDRHPGDPLFLPPTRGIVDASEDFNPSTAPVQLLRRKNSEIETLIQGDYSELPPSIRRRLGPAKEQAGKSFVVSTMLIQLLNADPSLELTGSGFDEKKSSADFTDEESETLLDQFFDFLLQAGGDDSAPKVASEESAGPRAQHKKKTTDKPRRQR